MIGLIVFYREHDVRLIVDHLSKMCRLTSNFQGHDLSKKWGRLKELPNFPHLGEEEILKTLDFFDTKSLQEELHHISQYVLEENFFKVGLSIHAGRSHAVQLKKSKKAYEASPNILRSSFNDPLRGQGEKGSSLVKKRRVNDAMGLLSNGEIYREVIRPLMIDITALKQISEEMIRKMDVESQFNIMLDEWNAEFVKDDRSRTELIEARIETNQKNEVLKALAKEKSALDIMNKELHDHLSEKEVAILNADARIETISLEAAEKFKHLQLINHVQEAYNKLFDAEERDLECRCLGEGFIFDFLKGAQLVQRKAGATIEGLSPGQASEDSSLDLDDDDVESELKKASPVMMRMLKYSFFVI
ncbi:hypothetical protein IEQ34_013154 [Dendrobium chrysotoxum]|uniref:Uncharacterized protein n=1 Tax=Dendrobium chrysotoxum TaxID=161865 RepID=A0AAV7GQ70_DENCH|nr:hypothetical protein IEQ34_013154 [Dendrobium chrysotoxum]